MDEGGGLRVDWGVFHPKFFLLLMELDRFLIIFILYTIGYQIVVSMLQFIITIVYYYHPQQSSVVGWSIATGPSLC